MADPQTDHAAKPRRPLAQEFVSLVLRAAICIFLLCQLLAPFPLAALVWFSTALAWGADTPPPQPWLFYALLAYIFVSSAILIDRLFFRVVAGNWRYILPLLAVANVSIFTIPMLYVYKGYAYWRFWLPFGIPFLMNALILAVVLSNRLQAFIFPPISPPTLPDWYKDALPSQDHPAEP